MMKQKGLTNLHEKSKEETEKSVNAESVNSKSETFVNHSILNKLADLRRKMKERGIDFYLISTDDYHASEYISDYFQTREYMSGFTGSNGNLIISMAEAGLWTDGRYFIQAKEQLQGTSIVLYRMLDEGVPTMGEYLYTHMTGGQCLGFDGKCVTAGLGLMLEQKLKGKEIRFHYTTDLVGEIWTDRPSLPSHEIRVLDIEESGMKYEEKLALVKEKMASKKADFLFISKLDDLMWLFNIRGGDVSCNPVALSYGFITMDETYLFIQSSEMDEKLSDYLKEHHVIVREYQDVETFLSAYRYENKAGEKRTLMLDQGNMSFSLFKLLMSKTKLIQSPNPTEILKAVKNKTEMERIREIYLKDSAAVCRAIYWLKQHILKEPVSEVDVADKFDEMRKQIPEFLDLSFPTISGYGPNGAIVHYEATPEKCSMCKPQGMILVDSGGQYTKGTTDITRTIVLGEISEEEKCHFSKVAAGMLRLGNTKFLRGCTGRNLDIIVREPLWSVGLDFKHGTGHGIGYILNVHEGPQSLRWSDTKTPECVLEPGMLLSDEPGIYIEGKYGIRTENILEVTEGVHNEYGQFLGFKMLTYVPIDKAALDKKYLTKEDIMLADQYHKDVYEKIAPLLNTEEQKWLYEATRPL